jgi:hypothetical protein
MRGPAQVKPWLSEEEFLVWIREAASREAYQKRLAIWLTKIGPFHADEVAKMLGVSKQLSGCGGQYNGWSEGPAPGRGGRRWSLLSWPQEEALLKSFERGR